MDIERILKTRENAIYYGIGEYQKDCFGWVGGNAPACFDDKYLSDKDNLYFYLTFQFDPSACTCSLVILSLYTVSAISNIFF